MLSALRWEMMVVGNGGSARNSPHDFSLITPRIFESERRTEETPGERAEYRKSSARWRTSPCSRCQVAREAFWPK